MKVYLKLFLAAAIPYTLALTVLFRSSTAGLILGVLFGVVIAGLFGTLQIRSMKGKQKADESYAVNQVREIEIDSPFDEAVTLARAAIHELGLNVQRESSIPITEDESLVTLEAHVGLNWETYGEKVTLRVERLDDDTSLIRVESRPRLRTTIIDYGRNLHNVNVISQYLREHTAADHLRIYSDDEATRFYEESLAVKDKQ